MHFSGYMNHTLWKNTEKKVYYIGTIILFNSKRWDYYLNVINQLTYNKFLILAMIRMATFNQTWFEAAKKSREYWVLQDETSVKYKTEITLVCFFLNLIFILVIFQNFNKKLHSKNLMESPIEYEIK